MVLQSTEKEHGEESGAVVGIRRISKWRRWCLNPTVYLEIVAIALIVTMLFRQQHELGCLALAALGITRVYATPNTTLPQYVFDYAPLIWLDESEAYFPSDMAAQVANTRPAINLTLIDTDQVPSPLNLYNLNDLNTFGLDVYLTSIVDPTTSPVYLNGDVPSSTTYRTDNAISCAVILYDHADGSNTTDAFYMYFYAYNQGNTVLGQELGDHIGDWEHNMVRFVNGIPQAVWYSQHGNGEAFLYSVVEKNGLRPIAYSALGSHANYAIAGTHDHTIPDLNLPAGLLMDYTSQGTLWDPVLNAYFYTYDNSTATFTAADAEQTSPVEAMQFLGKWGDQQYADSDSRQAEFFGFAKYVGGPTGPIDKGLVRSKVCPDNGYLCIVREILGP